MNFLKFNTSLNELLDKAYKMELLQLLPRVTLIYTKVQFQSLLEILLAKFLFLKNLQSPSAKVSNIQMGFLKKNDLEYIQIYKSNTINKNKHSMSYGYNLRFFQLKCYIQGSVKPFNETQSTIQVTSLTLNYMIFYHDIKLYT